jgi:phage gpG-like protein
MITLELDNDAVIDALSRLAGAVDANGPHGLRIALMRIGERLVESSRQRFVTGTAPDGGRWKPNAQSTFLRYLASPDRGRNQRADGRLNTRGAAQAMNKRPLVDTGSLRDSIAWQMVGESLWITSNWGDFTGGAAVHQLGSVNGRIPARPFLGLSHDDQATVLDIIGQHIQNGST